jgi:hypothetical protein
MARKPQIVAANANESTAPQPDDTCAPAKWGTGMSNEDRRAKLVELLRQKEAVAPGWIFRPKNQRRQRQKGSVG